MPEPSRSRDVLARIRQGSAASPPGVDARPTPPPAIVVPEMAPPAPPASWGALAAAVSIGAVVLSAILAALASRLGASLLSPR